MPVTNGPQPVDAEAAGSFRVAQANTPGKIRADQSGTAPPSLFRPLTVRGIEFANRIFVSPMCMYSCKDGVATDFHLVHAAQFVMHGVGLFMVEATAVVPNGRISSQDLGIWDDAHIAPLKRIVDLVHSFGGKIGIQLAHAGRKASTYPLWMSNARGATPKEQGGWPDQVVGPTAEPYPELAQPHALTTDEVAELVKAFGAAADRARRAGFDLIEIHGAHGYLIHEFLSNLTNTRTDAYGADRARFLREIVLETRRVWQGPLSVRFSCSDWNPASTWENDVVDVAKQVVGLGIDMIDCSAGALVRDQKFPEFKHGFQIPYAARIKKAVGPDTVVVGVGMITDPVQSCEYIAQGQCDAVMLAREFLRNPGWVYHAAKALGVKVNMIHQYERGQE